VHCRKNTYDDEARRYCGLISPQQGREGVIWQGLRPSHVDIAAARSGLGQAQAAGVGLDDSGACNYPAAPARRIGGQPPTELCQAVVTGRFGRGASPRQL